MTRAELIEQINRKRSFLCVGLDTDLSKIPQHLLDDPDPIFSFNKAIVEATSDLTVAYKPNIAFYECLGPQGWESLEKTLEIIPEHCFTIADAKRGDIGNTSRYYAQTFFERYSFDAVTVAPYMGSDSVLPFLEFDEKWVILLALTSNKGADDFQFIADQNKRLFEHVLEQGAKWGNPERLMFVAGATRPEMLAEIRKVVPEHFLLVPGVGAQGGSLADVAKHGMTADCGLLVNSSRGIIYAGSGTDYADQSRAATQAIQREMATLLA